MEPLSPTATEASPQFLTLLQQLRLKMQQQNSQQIAAMAHQIHEHSPEMLRSILEKGEAFVASAIVRESAHLSPPRQQRDDGLIVHIGGSSSSRGSASRPGGNFDKVYASRDGRERPTTARVRQVPRPPPAGSKRPASAPQRRRCAAGAGCSQSPPRTTPSQLSQSPPCSPRSPRRVPPPDPADYGCLWPDTGRVYRDTYNLARPLQFRRFDDPVQRNQQYKQIWSRDKYLSDRTAPTSKRNTPRFCKGPSQTGPRNMRERVQTRRDKVMGSNQVSGGAPGVRITIQRPNTARTAERSKPTTPKREVTPRCTTTNFPHIEDWA